jgi:hypothetical protein
MTRRRPGCAAAAASMMGLICFGALPCGVIALYIWLG